MADATQADARAARLAAALRANLIRRKARGREVPSDGHTRHSDGDGNPAPDDPGVGLPPPE